MNDQDDFSVKFWGVRGSIACSGPETVRYGGNTSSLEVRCGDRIILLDGGSGIRYLGNELVTQGPLDVDLFLTHTHFDHVDALTEILNNPRDMKIDKTYGSLPDDAWMKKHQKDTA